ncbi:MAG: hypothetical protein ACFE9C_01150 [Candidatus Hodarchaeota archaeon]
MIDTIFRIYKIGKELGLTKREISSLFFFKNSRGRTFSIVLLVLIIVITITTLSVLTVFVYILIERNTYPTGTKYSTVKISDFRLEKNKAEIKFKSLKREKAKIN